MQLSREELKKLYFNVTRIANHGYRKSFAKCRKNFRGPNDGGLDKFRKCLEEFSNNEHWINDNLFNRLNTFRHRLIPWLNSLVSLENINVLEIGCGTGCVTVPLAEQGCNLTSIDIHEQAINVNKVRCSIYGLEPNISVMNAVDIGDMDECFDMVLFPDSMEHMTYSERLQVIKSAWDKLKAGGFLVVAGAPNRLYFFDRHSSSLHFFHWLPDDLAVQYAKHSPKKPYADTSFDKVKLQRSGRGVSFHEFELAVDKPCADLDVHDMQSFMRVPIFSRLAHRDEYRYKKLLKNMGPRDVPDGFYYEILQIGIRKPSDKQ